MTQAPPHAAATAASAATPAGRWALCPHPHSHPQRQAAAGVAGAAGRGSGADAPMSLCVRLARCDAGWQWRFDLRAPLRLLRIPPASARPAAADGLWRRTCFEVFVAEPPGLDGGNGHLGAHGGAQAYREFNFSPSGDWAAYTFSAERVRDARPPHALPAPRLRCTAGAHGLALVAWLPDAALPAPCGAPLPMGLCAVLERADDGRLEHWALHHPRPQPDFHHRAGWLAALPPAA